MSSRAESAHHLSQKQIECLRDSDARINIFEGPVRAGKSFVTLLRWIDFCLDGAPGPLIICGRTDKTIRRNIISPLQELVGNSLSYSIGKGEATFLGRLMYVIGANDDRAEAKIRGSEFAGALIDELTLLPENFCKMLLSRLSIPGAKLFASTNPDSPFHWVKREIIDRQAELDCKVFRFSINDNPSLSHEYKTQLSKEYQGLWKRRYIEGQWVLAEGTVFDFFDEEIHTINTFQEWAPEYFVSVDYGTTNPCVFLLFGYDPSAYPNIWLQGEYYYDSKKTLKQKTDSEYCDDFEKFIDGFSVKKIYIDPSAVSFREALKRRGFYNTHEANNDVLSGIRFHAKMLSDGAFKISKGCTETIREYHNYTWDTKLSNRGLEKPIKRDDHAMDAIRYFLYSHFFGKSIESEMTEEDANRLEQLYRVQY